jgi:hypothetical protein
MTISLYANVEIWRHCHAVFSRAKTCAKVVLIWRVTHKEQGRSSGEIKRWIFAEIQATDAGLGADRRWHQRLSSNPKTGSAGGGDRRGLGGDRCGHKGRQTHLSDLPFFGLQRKWWQTRWCWAPDTSVDRFCEMELTGVRTSTRWTLRPKPKDMSITTVHDRWFLKARGHVVASGGVRCIVQRLSVCDRRVRRSHSELNGSIRRGTSIYICWTVLSSNSCTLLHTCGHFELSNSLHTHLSCFFAYSKWDWVIQVHLHCEIASSWHLAVDLLCDSCFSWWLPPPRWLGASWRCWQELVIILCILWWLWGVCAYLGEAPKATLVDCSCHSQPFVIW